MARRRGPELSTRQLRSPGDHRDLTSRNRSARQRQLRRDVQDSWQPSPSVHFRFIGHICAVEWKWRSLVLSQSRPGHCRSPQRHRSNIDLRPFERLEPMLLGRSSLLSRQSRPPPSLPGLRSNNASRLQSGDGTIWSIRRRRKQCNRNSGDPLPVHFLRRLRHRNVSLPSYPT